MRGFDGKQLMVLLFACRELFDGGSRFLSEARSLSAFAFHSSKATGDNLAETSLKPSASSTAIFAADRDLTSESEIQPPSTSSSLPSSSKITNSGNNPSFGNFDYEDHWYPCIWERDLEVEEPTKVTIFDVDYVVAKTSKGEVIAMKDSCTHKGAALSEGRVTATGNFQCPAGCLSSALSGRSPAITIATWHETRSRPILSVHMLTDAVKFLCMLRKF